MRTPKGTTRRIWLTAKDVVILKKISDQTKLGQTALLSQFLEAALTSIAANGHTFRLPLKFSTAK